MNSGFQPSAAALTQLCPEALVGRGEAGVELQ